MSLSDFESGLKIEVAAQDSDLVGFYELRMRGDTDKIDDDRAMRLEAYTPEQMRGETCHIYELSEAEYRQALGLCVANIAGVEVGMST